MPLELYQSSYTIAELAEATGFSKNTILRAVNDCSLLAYDSSGPGAPKPKWRIYRPDAQRWLDARCNIPVRNGKRLTGLGEERPET